MQKLKILNSVKPTIDKLFRHSFSLLYNKKRRNIMDKKIGFIGAGKMAGAIIKGLLNANVVSPKNIIATQIETETIEERSKELGISIIQDNTLLAKNSDIIFVATKPNQVEDVLKEISSYITSDKLIVSIAAGVTTEKLEAYLPENTRVIRVMPNLMMILKLFSFY